MNILSIRLVYDRFFFESSLSRSNNLFLFVCFSKGQVRKLEDDYQRFIQVYQEIIIRLEKLEGLLSDAERAVDLTRISVSNIFRCHWIRTRVLFGFPIASSRRTTKCTRSTRWITQFRSRTRVKKRKIQQISCAWYWKYNTKIRRITTSHSNYSSTCLYSFIYRSIFPFYHFRKHKKNVHVNNNNNNNIKQQ